MDDISFPASALHHLEPQPGGSWRLEGEHKGMMYVTYRLADGSHLATATVKKCSNEADIEKHCSKFLYSLPPYHQSASHNGVSAAQGFAASNNHQHVNGPGYVSAQQIDSLQQYQYPLTTEQASVVSVASHPSEQSYGQAFQSQGSGMIGAASSLGTNLSEYPTLPELREEERRLMQMELEDTIKWNTDTQFPANGFQPSQNFSQPQQDELASMGIGSGVVDWNKFLISS